MSDSRQQYHIALSKWKAERDALLAESHPDSAFFNAVFGDGFLGESQEEFEAIEKKLSTSQSNRSVVEVLRGTAFSGRVLTLAHKIRNRLIDENNPEADEYQILLQEVRQRLYEDNRKVVKEIVDWASGEGGIPEATAPADVKVSRGRLRVLYWGVLGLVEGRDVTNEMIDFENQMRLWEENYPDVEGRIVGMKTAQEELEKAMQMELEKDITVLISL